MMPGLIMRYLFRMAVVTLVQVTLALLVVVWLAKLADALLQGAIRGSGDFGRMAVSSLRETPALIDAILPHAVLVAAGVVAFRLMRRFELPVLMAAGLSGWQLVRPFLATGFVAGIAWLVLIEPLVAYLDRQSIADRAERAGIALFEGTPDGRGRALVIADPAGAVYAFIDEVHAREGRTGPALVYRFDADGNFLGRIDATHSEIGEQVWRLFPRTPRGAAAPVDLAVEGRLLIAPPADRAIATTRELPGLIALAERTGRPVGRLQVRLHQALSLPVLLAAVAALAAVMAMRQRHRTLGGAAVAGELLMLGFGLFLGSTIAGALGARLVIAPALAVWVVPALVLVALAVMLRAQRL